MTTTTTPQHPDKTLTARVGTPTAVAVTGAILATNGLVLGSQMFLDSRDYSAVVQGPVHLAHHAIWTACLVALSQLYPLLAGLRGVNLPRVVLALAGAGAALDACTRFVSAFVLPFLAENDPVLVDEPPNALLLGTLLGAGVVAMIGTATLAAVAWRRRLAPRPALVLMFLGAVAIPAIGPLSTVLVGSGLVWFGITLRNLARS